MNSGRHLTCDPKKCPPLDTTPVSLTSVFSRTRARREGSNANCPCAPGRRAGSVGSRLRPSSRLAAEAVGGRRCDRRPAVAAGGGGVVPGGRGGCRPAAGARGRGRVAVPVGERLGAAGPERPGGAGGGGVLAPGLRGAEAPRRGRA